MRAVVFLGPSLSGEEAREVLDATYLPPAAQGDLTTAVVEERPDVLGLVDGVFLQSLSVWHKEILFALDRGIAVYGASSIGALRAAETAAFGMRGIGEIYRLYAEGVLEDDDEVALAHSAADDGYRKLSEPLVNVRATLAAAERAGIVDGVLAARVVAAAKEIYFADRTFPRIFERAAAEGVTPDALERLAGFIAGGYVDQKRIDALELLDTIAREGASASGSQNGRDPGFEFVRTTHFDTLYNRGRTVAHDGTAVALEEIANNFALEDDDFDDVNFHALNRALVAVFADHLGIDATSDEVEEECRRFRRRRGLERDEALGEWLAENDLDGGEFTELMGLVAVCRRLQRWYMVANWMERSTKVVLDELRLNGTYGEWARRAAAQERVLRARPEVDEREPISPSLDELVEAHREWTGRRFPIEARRWAEEAGFHGPDNLRAALKRSRAARLALLLVLADVDPTDDR